jgi:division protein CdvB (Snf7/Vps24/ESCRT-III family)
MRMFSSKPKKTTAEAMKDAKRDVRRQTTSATRDLDRELLNLNREETRCVNEIKAQAKIAKGQNDPGLKALAKQLVQIREQKNKIITQKAQLNGMKYQVNNMAATVAVTGAMEKVSGAMGTANAAMNPSDINKIMNDFQRENEKMNMKQELMDEALTDAFDVDEEETDGVVDQVLAELGLETQEKLSGLQAPTKKPPVASSNLTDEEKNALEGILPDLEARLQAL